MERSWNVFVVKNCPKWSKKDEKCKISSYSLNLLKSNGFSSIDENFSGNKKEYGEKNEIYLDEDEKTNLYKK